MEILKAIGFMISIFTSFVLIFCIGSFVMQVYENKKNIASILNELGFDGDSTIRVLTRLEDVKEK